MWVFGYGSLVWKADFAYSVKVVGHIRGYMRRFWQASTDHRGVPGAPGRVVTLLPAKEEKVWGIAYKIEEENVDEVMKYLNFREKNGYEQVTVNFYPDNVDSHGESIPLVVYIGTAENEHYLGEDTIENIAQQIAKSVGPSGSNKEYLFRLADALRELCPQAVDNHLFELDSAVRSICAASASS